MTDPIETFDQIPDICRRLTESLASVVVGQDQAVRLLLTALLSQGHTLTIGVPGLAKTLLVRCLSQALDLSFARVQFTPDTMPSDILGSELIQDDPATGRRSMHFVPGPIFVNLLLADEINRTPPKTQSAMLEAMAERQVTVAGESRKLPAPYLVVATQNPIEQEGTYPLPEAQLDRFAYSITLNYPQREQERDMVMRTSGWIEPTLEPVVSSEQLRQMQEAVRQMPVSETMADRAVALARATRPDDELAGSMVRQYVEWGAGPRAGQWIIRGAKAQAAMAGRPTPHQVDVDHVAAAVLTHRLVLNYQAVGDGISAANVVDAVMQSTDA